MERQGLVAALGLADAPGVVSIVGGGGKSSLMFALADALPGRVVMTTTTRIFAAQMQRAERVCSLDEAGWRQHLEDFEKGLLVVGGVEGSRALGVPLELPGELLAHPRVDAVLVEADGSRMLPVKAPAPHEPQVPPETALLVAVAGIDALDAPIEAVAHRPERVSALTGLAPEERLDARALAQLLASPEGGLKDRPANARAVVLLNKVETSGNRERARQVALQLLARPGVERVLIGALQGHLPEAQQATDSRDWEVHAR